MTSPTTARLLATLDTQVEAARRALCALRLAPVPDIGDYLWHMEQVADLYKLCGEHTALLTQAPPGRDSGQALAVLGRTSGCLGQAGAHLGRGLEHLTWLQPIPDGPPAAAGKALDRLPARLIGEVHQARTELFVAHSALHCEIQRLHPAASATRTPVTAPRPATAPVPAASTSRSRP